jgi:hypothetical protein
MVISLDSTISNQSNERVLMLVYGHGDSRSGSTSGRVFYPCVAAA